MQKTFLTLNLNLNNLDLILRNPQKSPPLFLRSDSRVHQLPHPIILIPNVSNISASRISEEMIR